MHGLMQEYPLTIQHLFTRGTRLFPRKEIVTRTDDGYHRYTYADFAERVQRLANALTTMGIRPGDRVATFGWNTYRHLELYFAIPCMGAVLHTLNIRLFTEQIEYVIADAEDQVIFVDADLVPLLEKLAGRMPTVRAYVIMGKPAAETTLAPAYDYEDLLASASAHYDWPMVDENSAAAMCYTSGTTGNPKGVVYSHRSVYLHSFGVCMADSLGLSERDVVLPVVPMFHANAWGLAHAAIMTGSKLMLPGRNLGGAQLVEMIEQERVTVPAGVPSIWIGLLAYLERLSVEKPIMPDLSSVRAVPCGGSAIPPALMRGFDRFGLPLLHAWGMTETSPLASVSRVNSGALDGTYEEKLAIRSKQGQPVPGVDCRVVNLDTGEEVPRDSTSVGEIQVRGPWIARAYYHDEGNTEKFMDGWLRTGDVATVDADGYLQIVDRTKDLVKSGGEWISSVELENLIMAYPKVLEAAVIGVPHAVLQERPVAYVVPKPEYTDQLTADEILEYLRPQVAKWWLPDQVLFIDAIPKTSVGKFSKRELRDRYAVEGAATAAD
ncbi:MAG: Long-chain-fatty-acid--CoA ligase [Ktedonobacterales bacterium]|jgi:fatty-acyl-CoA synthase|nr:MAG: Long-chain-fatty-acid--CoA ligase [Ktedonobacterales bacterium]